MRLMDTHIQRLRERERSLRVHGEKSRGVGVFVCPRGAPCERPYVERARDDRRRRVCVQAKTSAHGYTQTTTGRHRRACVVLHGRATGSYDGGGDGHWSDRLVIRSVLVNAPGAHPPFGGGRIARTSCDHRVVVKPCGP